MVSSNIEKSIQLAISFAKKWEKLASKSPNGTSYYSNTDSLPDSTLVYAYPDGKGYSIGWGIYDTLNDGTKITGRQFSIPKGRADSEIVMEMREKEKQIRGWITKDLTIPQYAAVLDVVYSAGAGSLKYNGSALLNAINSGSDISPVLLTTAITDSGTGNVLTVLKNRRKDEAQLFNGSYNDTYSYYLRNESTVNYAVIGGVIIALTGYIYYLKTKKII